MNHEGGRCDFCQVEEAKFTINGGLWWLCQSCWDVEYGHVKAEEVANRGEEE